MSAMSNLDADLSMLERDIDKINLAAEVAGWEVRKPQGAALSAWCAVTYKVPGRTDELLVASADVEIKVVYYDGNLSDDSTLTVGQVIALILSMPVGPLAKTMVGAES